MKGLKDVNHIPYGNMLARQFFSGYLVDHYLYKQYTFYNAIQKYPELKSQVLEGMDDVEDGKYIETLRLEIRATYFQAMETLFELIFGLEPKKEGIDYRNLWYSLSTSEWQKNYQRIGAMAAGNRALIDSTVITGKGGQQPFVQYLFYFGAVGAELPDTVKASIEPIKRFLVAFAEEFSNRGEYNAFKHALRIFPTLKTLEFGQQEKQEALLTIDMTNSMTYVDEQGDSLTFHTNKLETERDMRMTVACSRLISNIVRSRRAHFEHAKEWPAHTFTDAIFSTAVKHESKWLDFKFSITPIYGPTEGLIDKNSTGQAAGDNLTERK